MNNCALLDDLLLDGSPEAMAAADRHAAACATCAAALASWREISATASSLRAEWPSDLLWPRIERSLRERARTSPRLRLFQAAAAAIVFLVLGGTMFYALRVQTARAAFDREILGVSALDEVERAERAHMAAIRQLEKQAGAKLDDPATPLLVSYKEKLMLLDDAIAECETAIERNRQNAHLRKQLLAMYSEKQATLTDVLREDTHESNR